MIPSSEQYIEEIYFSIQACLNLGGLWRRPYGILIARIWTLLAEKVADIAEKLAKPFIQS